LSFELQPLKLYKCLDKFKCEKYIFTIYTRIGFHSQCGILFPFFPFQKHIAYPKEPSPNQIQVESTEHSCLHRAKRLNLSGRKPRNYSRLPPPFVAALAPSSWFLVPGLLSCAAF